MAQVIRDAVIRLKWEQSKAKLESPDFANQKRAAEEVKKSTTEVTKATVEATRATTEHTRVVQDFGFKSVVHFREAGEGAFRMARGLALLSAGGSDDLRKLVQSVALAQGAFDVFAGGFKVVTNLTALLGGPFTAAIAVVTTAIAGLTSIWLAHRSEVERNTEAVRKHEEQQKKLLDRIAAERASRQGGDRSFAALEISAAATPGERQRRIDAEESRLRKEESGLAISEQIARKGTTVFGADTVVSATARRAETLEQLIQLEREDAQVKQDLLRLDRERALEAVSKTAGGRPQPGEIDEVELRYKRKLETVLQTSEQALDGLIAIYKKAKEVADQERGYAEARNNSP